MNIRFASRLFFGSLIIATCLLLQSCRTTYGTKSPPPAPEPGKAVIVFYAQHGGMDNLDKVKVDGKYIRRFSPGYFFTTQVLPGEHKITSGFGLRWEDKIIRVEAGQTYYVCSEVAMHLLTSNKQLIIVDPDEGRAAVSRLRRWEKK